MRNDLVVKQSSQLALKKTKRLMGITSKILAGRNELTAVDENWMYRLWEWADENGIDEETLPRKTVELTQLTQLIFFCNELSELPKEIGQLTQLEYLLLGDNELTELPKEIRQLTQLTRLYLYNNKLIELPKDIVQLKRLDILDLEGNPNLILTVEQKSWIVACLMEFKINEQINFKLHKTNLS